MRCLIVSRVICYIFDSSTLCACGWVCQIDKGGWSFFPSFCIFLLFGERSVVLGSTGEVFLDNSIFSLTACHYLSAPGNKSFSICHSYLFYICFLSSTAFFLHVFPQALSFFYYFDFFSLTSELF